MTIAVAPQSAWFAEKARIIASWANEATSAPSCVYTEPVP
jgi:hypothetical protein